MPAKVEAAFIFTAGSNQDWLDFDVGEPEAMALADWIAQDEPTPPVEYAKGIDVSQWQGEIDWQAVANDGTISFCFIRATVGDRLDPYWETNYQGATNAGLLVGAYHYLEAGVGGQAGTFARAVAGKDLALGYWCDIEDDALTADKCETFLGYADDKCGERLGIYTRASFFDRFGTPDWAVDRLLWVADWRGDWEPILPMAWGEWEFWQTTSDGSVPGIEGRVDLDVYAGTPEQLYSAYGNGEGGDMWESVGFADVELVDVTRERFDSFWGINMKRFVPAGLPAGAVYYKLVRLAWREGWCGLALKVVDEDGNPLEGEQVFQGWEDGADLPADVAPLGGQPEMYPNKGGGGFTNAEGVHGWGWGAGEWFDPSVTEGPHWYWRGGENGAYSDVVCGFGWWDEHEVLEPTFMRVVVDDPEPPEPPTPEDDSLVRIADAAERIADALEVIAAWKWPFT